MPEPAAKEDDRIISNGTSKVWVQPPSSPPLTVVFDYDGLIDSGLSSNVFIMGKPAATINSTATNSMPPNTQLDVTSQGTINTEFDNTGTISTGSSSVFINSKKAAGNGDKAKTWDYSSSTPAPPANDNALEIENAEVNASGSVFIGD